MRGKYIGRDGSMGFRTGQTYEISTELTGEVRKANSFRGWIDSTINLYFVVYVLSFLYTFCVILLPWKTNIDIQTQQYL